MKLRLRSIHAQLIASFLLFEILALALFSGLLLHEGHQENEARITRRLVYQSTTVAALCRRALEQGSTPALNDIVSSMLQFPTIGSVSITGPHGEIAASSDRRLNEAMKHTRWDPSFQAPAGLNGARILRSAGQIRGAVAPVRIGSRLAGYVWVTPSMLAFRSSLADMLAMTLWGALGVLLACSVVAALIARSISRPLTRLLAATRRMVRNPQDTSAFPLAVSESNSPSEATDLIVACNRMVAAIEEQRSGLNDTLSLLDSMLAHAPIGVAFFDSKGSIVRVNRFLAEMQGRPVEFYLGHTLEEVFAPEAAARVRHAVEHVFARAEAVRDLEVREPARAGSPRPDSPQSAATTWQMHMYPVRSSAQEVRWAGALVVDISSRLQAEEALRKSEKLAAVGRLAASIAHEINNPLEAVTNLLYLLQYHTTLEPEANEWVTSAQHEVARVSAITQQTLRFYRQSTRPVRANLPELLDSVLTLYQGRINTLQVELVRRFRQPPDLLCLTGEMRQLFANLIGNALDAMQPGGGRLVVSARAAADVCRQDATGVRVTIADTGSGMSREVRDRIFEPFFTTKEATGTGLGLWVGAEIMAKHGVRLRIRSRVADREGAHGTVFSLFFPADFALPSQSRGAPSPATQ